MHKRGHWCALATAWACLLGRQGATVWSLHFSVAWLIIFTEANLCSRAIERLRDYEMERRDADPDRIALCELILGAVRLRDSCSR